jgi:mersacidin/lichenicidin family type 2 lantibiotic
MKFDVVRAWKDEAYRQTLDDEQLSTLPANPAGELSDSELASVCGGSNGPWDPYWGFGVGIASSSSSLASILRHRLHSWGLTCDIDVFSADVQVIGVDRLVNIGTTETRFCIESH